MHLQSPSSADQTIYQVLPTPGRGIRNVYFLHVQTKTPKEGTKLWCDTEEFLNMHLKQILVRNTHVG